IWEQFVEKGLTILNTAGLHCLFQFQKPAHLFQVKLKSIFQRSDASKEGLTGRSLPAGSSGTVINNRTCCHSCALSHQTFKGQIGGVFPLKPALPLNHTVQ